MKTNILIADDEPNQLELMSYNLETSGFATIKARDGKNALQLIEDHSPDLVILDWIRNITRVGMCAKVLLKRYQMLNLCQSLIKPPPLTKIVSNK